MFPTQIVVTKELEEGHHKWLKALSGQLGRENFYELLESRKMLAKKADQELADSILEVCIGANRQLLEELKGDDNVYEALMEIMEPRIKQREEKIRKEEQEKGIQGTIVALRDLGIEGSQIKASIMKAYKLSEDEAEEYL